jgi:hypothetical protein
VPSTSSLGDEETDTHPSPSWLDAGIAVCRTLYSTGILQYSYSRDTEYYYQEPVLHIVASQLFFVVEYYVLCTATSRWVASRPL